IPVLTQLTPSLHGLYRAITSTLYPWTATQWHHLSQALQLLVEGTVLERINRLLLDIHSEAEAEVEGDAQAESQDELDPDPLTFAHTFVARYIAQGRPLSGYFIVCCVMEMQWTVLAQALVPPSLQSPKPSSEARAHGGYAVAEAAAANKAWLALMRRAGCDLRLDVNASEDGDGRENTGAHTKDALKATLQYALQCFNELLAQIEGMATDPPIDTYAWETMSESLKLASICTIALRELDDELYTLLTLLLSDASPVSDNLVQEAALKAATSNYSSSTYTNFIDTSGAIIISSHLSFPEIAPSLVNHLRRFVTSPLPIFEFAFGGERRAPPPLTAAAKCLALCIKLAPGDDPIMSNMYSLLNYIAATNKEIFENSSNQLMMNHPFYPPSEYAAEHVSHHGDADTGFSGHSEEEKRLIGITTISVVTRLALEFNLEEVTKLTISMLLQRLRTAEPTVEAAIAYNLVDLALSAPESSFSDTIRVFSSINRTANSSSDDPRFSSNMVLAAQTRLARELGCRPDLYDMYLVELLTLFSDKGVAIQNVAVSDQHVKTEDMIEQLASLLLPIEALLDHADCNPQLSPSPELVTLFRNMWFLCVLFHFTSGDDGEGKTTEWSHTTREWSHTHTALEWLKPALMRIATKTPRIVLESAADSASDFEYCTVIRREYVHQVGKSSASALPSKYHAFLARHISIRASEIQRLPTSHVIFLLVMHDMESMRSASGLPASLPTYFANGSLNRLAGLSACMESIAEKVCATTSHVYLSNVTN
ncbi:hypothetical protein BJ138DRAFT_1120668, partial [Hygrophoropsis aurantiaca]